MVLKLRETAFPDGVVLSTVLLPVPSVKWLPAGISAVKVEPETVIESASDPERA